MSSSVGLEGIGFGCSEKERFCRPNFDVPRTFMAVAAAVAALHMVVVVVVVLLLLRVV